MMRKNFIEYPIDALTPIFHYAGKDTHTATQAPDALIALVLLSSAAAVCQRLIDVVLPVANGLLSPASLYLMFIGESGERRSAVNSLVAAPLYAHDEEITRKQDEYTNIHRSKLEIWKLKKKGILKRIRKLQEEGLDTDPLELELIAHNGLEPAPPRARQIVHQDMTATAIHEALEGDGEAIALITDEGQLLLESAAMRNLGLFNKLWDGPRTLPLARAGNKVITVHNSRTTMHVMSHYEVVQKYMQKKGDIARGSGTLARFLIAMPPSNKGYREARFDSSTMPDLDRFRARLGELIKLNDKLAESRTKARLTLQFTEQAASLWRRTANDIELGMRPGGDYAEISDIASKTMENASRIAAIMHYFEGYAGGISEDVLRRAIEIAMWHLWEFHRLFVDGSEPTEEVDARKLLTYLERKYWNFGATEVESTTISHNCGLRPKARMDAAVDVLVRWNEIVVVPYERDKRKYKIRAKPQRWSLGATPQGSF
ncbi:YfjI family protein [Stenotrophomonas maltophilia]|uniref:YfjI family protein n=3 Tax=Stenotrophomonas maltophilia TaxID=40324 RepID=UPI000C154AA9|nr:YfjI family protein [Stenotrophomonas maltophilia]